MKHLWRALLLVLLLVASAPLHADDTCIFSVTADSVPPNVLILLDNGADMENIIWREEYNDAQKWSPQTYWDTVNGYTAGSGCDAAKTGPDWWWQTSYLNRYGDGGYYFCNQNGYAVDAGYLRPVKSDLTIDSSKGLKLQSDGTLRTPVVMELDGYTIKYYKTNGLAQSGYPYTYSPIPAGKSVNVGDPVVAATYTSSGVVTHVSRTTWPLPGDPTYDSDGDGYYVDTWTDSGNTYEMAYKWDYTYVSVQETSTTLFNAFVSEAFDFGSNPNKFRAYTWVDASNRKILVLPMTPDSTVDSTGVKDNATRFRYTGNYLNWLLRSGQYTGPGGNDLGIDHDNNPATVRLPKTRLYAAKKAILEVAKLTGNKANFGLNAFSSTSVGSSNIQPLKQVVTAVYEDPNLNQLDPNVVNTINNLGTVTYSPLAEGLADLGGVFAGKSTSGYVSDYYCQKSFSIILTAGLSSQDTTPSSQGLPTSLSNFDADTTEGVIPLKSEGPVTVPLGLNGSSYLDDVAHYQYTHDMIPYRAGFQNLSTYTVGIMTSEANRRFLINTSNNGNGNFNLYDTSDPEYGKYHFDATSPAGVKQALMNALSSVLSRTASFTAPVVPVTRTTSGDLIYLAFFKPLNNTNFWEGNITKFGLGSENAIIDKNGDPATWPNGAMKDTAVPYWATKDWGDSSKSNYMPNASRNIFTYMGSSLDLTDASNAFALGNSAITGNILGNPAKDLATFPTKSARDLLIDYIRGADAYDDDRDKNIAENRRIIHADALHAEPVVVAYSATSRVVYFGANDGMLHAVNDSDGKELWGFIPPDQLHRLRELTEGVAHPYFIDSSPRVMLNDLNNDGYIAGTGESAILVCGERMGGKSYFALDITNPAAPKYLWRMTDHDDRLSGDLIFPYGGVTGSFLVGETVRGSTSGATAVVTAALTVNSVSTLTNTVSTYKLAYSGRNGTFVPGETVQGQSSLAYSSLANISYNAPTDALDTLRIVDNLAHTWSEPRFTRVKTQSGFECSASNASCYTSNADKWTDAFVVGGGYSTAKYKGNFILIAKVSDGTILNKVTDSAMIYSIPSSVTVLDADYDSFADKLYVGDTGGQLWRVGKFDTDERLMNGVMTTYSLAFPETNENATFWTAKRLLDAGCDEGAAGSCTDLVDNDGDGLADERRKFFYAPDVTLEIGYDLVFIGSGDRDNACSTATDNRIYVVKDNHQIEPFVMNEVYTTLYPPSPIPTKPWLLVNALTTVPNLSDPSTGGYYVPMDHGDKVLAEGIVFYKVYYVTVFSPTTTDPCTPGGVTKLYSLAYKTGQPGVDMNGDGTKDLYTVVGGGIGSKPVIIMREGEKVGLLISVGSTNPDDTVGSTTGAGVVSAEPEAPAHNFQMLWWREIR